MLHSYVDINQIYHHYSLRIGSSSSIPSHSDGNSFRFRLVLLYIPSNILSLLFMASLIQVGLGVRKVSGAPIRCSNIRAPVSAPNCWLYYIVFFPPLFCPRFIYYREIYIVSFIFSLLISTSLFFSWIHTFIIEPPSRLFCHPLGGTA